MNIVYPDAGLVAWAVRAATANFRYHLLGAELPGPASDMTLADLTELAIAGYVPIDVTLADMATRFVTDRVGFLQSPPILFQNISGSDAEAWGYFVTDVDDSQLLTLAIFDGAPILKNHLSSWAVLPQIRTFSEFLDE